MTLNHLKLPMLILKKNFLYEIKTSKKLNQVIQNALNPMITYAFFNGFVQGDQVFELIDPDWCGGVNW